MEKMKILVFGKVQGVFFRANSLKKAEDLDLSGWAKNLPDGSLEIVIQGEPSHVDSFIEFIKMGPPMAEVHEIKIEKYKGKIDKGFKRF